MSEGIVHNNMDIIDKMFTETFRDTSFAVYGLDLPRIKEFLPTDFPVVQAHERRADGLPRFEDDSIGIVEYKSEHRAKDVEQFIDYYSQAVKRYGYRTRIRMIVVYTADVDPKQVTTEYNNHSMKFTYTAAFLSKLDAAGISRQITDKIRRGEPLSEEERMEFVILPLAAKGKEAQRENFRKSIELAKRIPDENVSAFLITGLVVFGDKVIDEETSNKAKEWLKMTKIGRAFAREREEAVAAAVAVKEREKAAAVAETAAMKDREKAADTVAHVENVAKSFQVPVEVACEKMNIAKSAYEEAKKLLARAASVAL